MSKAQCPLAPEEVAKMQNSVQGQFAIMSALVSSHSVNIKGMKNASALAKHYPNGFTPYTFKQSSVGKHAILDLLAQGKPIEKIICIGGSRHSTYMCEELYEQFKKWCYSKSQQRAGQKNATATTTKPKQTHETDTPTAGPTAGPRQLELMATTPEPKPTGPTAGPQQPTPAPVPPSEPTTEAQRANSGFKPDTSVPANITKLMGKTEHQAALTKAQAQFMYDELHDLIFVNGLEEIIESVDYVMLQFAINSMGKNTDEYDADCLKMVRNIRDIFNECRKKKGEVA